MTEDNCNITITYFGVIRNFSELVYVERRPEQVNCDQRWTFLPPPRLPAWSTYHCFSAGRLRSLYLVSCHSCFKSSHSFYAMLCYAKSLQLCLTLCDPIEGSPPGSPVPGILQARTLEWVAISFSSAWKWKVKVRLLSRAWLLATPWTAAYQAPPSMGFSRQEYWSGVPLPSP